jgi:hypothetical protein
MISEEARSPRRVGSALAGMLLLLLALYEGYTLADQSYCDYVLYPAIKEGYLSPTRWQDIVALVILWAGTPLLFWCSFRLFKYSLGRTDSRPL